MSGAEELLSVKDLRKRFAVKGGIHLIAEGIETREELESLRALGVPFGQGFLLGVPRDAAATESWPARITVPGALV